MTGSHVRLRWFMPVLVLALLLVGCQRPDRVRIAGQEFAEGRILAEMMAATAEAEGVPVERLIPYGGSRVCLEAIRSGVIDAYPGYGGNLSSVAGLPSTSDPEAVAAQARELVEPLGLRWAGRFGLRNDFSLAMRSDVAFQWKVSRISELAARRGPLRFALDDDFAMRMSDGFGALVRRYGLSVADPLRFPRKDWAAVEALLKGRAEVAVLYQTDPAIGDFGLVRLEDDLGFFPAYEPAPLARAAVLERHPGLRRAWDALEGRITTDAMRDLVARVDRGGEDEATVAREALALLGVLPGAAPSRARTHVTLAVRPLSQKGIAAVLAAQALRTVMPARPLRVVFEDRPAEAVRTGRARYGLVGAEEFLIRESDRSDGLLRMSPNLEAVGAVATRVAHLVVPTDAPPLRGLERIRVATGPEDGSAHRVATLLVGSLDVRERVEIVPSSEPEALLDDGLVDALLMTAAPGHAHLRALLGREDRSLHPLGALSDVQQRLRHPVLRPARIPAGTYRDQDEPFETVASQVVLATFRPESEDPVGESGPGLIPGLGRNVPLRLPASTAARIQQALGPVEEVDPLLPTSPGLAPPKLAARTRVPGDPDAAVLNVLAMAFLVAMAAFYFAREPEQPALESGSKPDEG